MVTFVFHLTNPSGEIPANGTICDPTDIEKDNPLIVFFTPISGGSKKSDLGLGLGLGFPVLIIFIIAAGYWNIRRKERQRRKLALANVRERIAQD